jgi:hypothetical protein
MKYNFFDLAKETLLTVKKPLSIKDIWENSVELGFANKVSCSGKTPWQTLGAKIYMDIKQNPDSDFLQVSKRPAKFYLKDLYCDSDNDSHCESNDREDIHNEAMIEHVKSGFHERDLHVLLSTFVFSNPHFSCYTKTIYHEKSKKNVKGANKGVRQRLLLFGTTLLYIMLLDCEKTPHYQRQCAKTRFAITTSFAADQYASLGVYWGHGILDGSAYNPFYDQKFMDRLTA